MYLRCSSNISTKESLLYISSEIIVGTDPTFNIYNVRTIKAFLSLQLWQTNIINSCLHTFKTQSHDWVDVWIDLNIIQIISNPGIVRIKYDHIRTLGCIILSIRISKHFWISSKLRHQHYTCLYNFLTLFLSL